jgi:hypothetical protein
VKNVDAEACLSYDSSQVKISKIKTEDGLERLAAAYKRDARRTIAEDQN